MQVAARKERWWEAWTRRSGAAVLVGLIALAVIVGLRLEPASPAGDGSVSPYRFSNEGVIWTEERRGWFAWRSATHWAAANAQAAAGQIAAWPPLDPRAPEWIAWPKQPAEVLYTKAWGWPLPALVESVRGTRLRVWAALADWLVLTLLVLPVIPLLEAIAVRIDAALQLFARAREDARLRAQAEMEAERLREWEKQPVCPECQYDLGGLPRNGLRCPECGWMAAVPERHRRTDAEI